MLVRQNGGVYRLSALAKGARDESLEAINLADWIRKMVCPEA
jgi:hypothetical protein